MKKKRSEMNPIFIYWLDSPLGIHQSDREGVKPNPIPMHGDLSPAYPYMVVNGTCHASATPCMNLIIRGFEETVRPSPNEFVRADQTEKRSFAQDMCRHTK
jgi:hypothetical protein